jgi:hypothetical protein
LIAIKKDKNLKGKVDCIREKLTSEIDPTTGISRK